VAWSDLEESIGRESTGEPLRTRSRHKDPVRVKKTGISNTKNWGIMVKEQTSKATKKDSREPTQKVLGLVHDNGAMLMGVWEKLNEVGKRRRKRTGTSVDRLRFQILLGGGEKKKKRMNRQMSKEHNHSKEGRKEVQKVKPRKKITHIFPKRKKKGTTIGEKAKTERETGGAYED